MRYDPSGHRQRNEAIAQKLHIDNVIASCRYRQRRSATYEDVAMTAARALG
jgi:hypothetical protein